MLPTRLHNVICAGLMIGGLGLALAIAVTGNRALTPFELIGARAAAGVLLAAFALLIAELIRPRRRRSPTVNQENPDHGIR